MWLGGRPGSRAVSADQNTVASPRPLDEKQELGDLQPDKEPPSVGITSFAGFLKVSLRLQLYHTLKESHHQAQRT